MSEPNRVIHARDEFDGPATIAVFPCTLRRKKIEVLIDGASYLLNADNARVLAYELCKAADKAAGPAPKVATR